MTSSCSNKKQKEKIVEYTQNKSISAEVESVNPIKIFTPKLNKSEKNQITSSYHCKYTLEVQYVK